MNASRRAVGRRVAAGLALSLLALALACSQPMPDRQVLDRSWSAYRSRFVSADGRVVRPEHGGDTVSEGQAYTMLRAVWMNDRATFDRVWRWAVDHLARTGREHPDLWAWHWAPAEGGRVVDWNVATDADTDAALALLMAAERWPSPSPGLPAYDAAARAALAGLLSFAVPDADGTLVMLPGAWADQRADSAGGLVLNPSYFSPAAYRVFATRTREPRWTAVADGAYRVLHSVCRGAGTPVVPDWVRWTSVALWRADGESPRSSWDAVRVPWRVATDLLWFDAVDARAFLTACIEPSVRAAAARGGGLAVERDLEGREVGADDHPLANALFAMAAARPQDARRLLARVRARFVTRDGQLFFGDPDRYYVNSLAYLPFLARSGGYTPPRPFVDHDTRFQAAARDRRPTRSARALRAVTGGVTSRRDGEAAARQRAPGLP